MTAHFRNERPHVTILCNFELTTLKFGVKADDGMLMHEATLLLCERV